ncbi:hypothetical protein PENSPDRAFT_28686 [Peniophora sp. CONT]|nr:hypothetical protein PENSPDRAFT_28686 [Peniophora sp. CONT]
MPKQLLAVAARCEEKSLAQRLQVVELELENIRLRKVVAHKEGSSTLWQLRASMSSLNSTTLTRIFNELQASFLVLTPDDQSALKQGIATLYSIAATTVTAGSGGDTFNAWFAVWLNPGAVFAAFLPMAAVYIIAYLCWRRMRLLTPANVSRGLREARMDTIMLIDVLGVHMLLPLDRVSTWRDFHDILLHQFANREGAEYVKRQAYRITDAAEESAIEPHSWLQSVRAGMTLDMSILVHLQLLGCPYCGNLTGEYLQEGQRTPCLKCGRQYWVTRRSQNASDVDVESASSTLQAPSDDAHATASMSHSPESYRPGMRSARASQDMSMFRRITIVLEEAFNNSGDLPYAHSQTKDSQQRHVDDENAPTQESALGLAFNTTSASTVKQDEDPLVALDEIQASSTFEQFSPSEFFQEDDGQSTFNGPLPLQSHDYDADHSLPQSPLKKEGYLPPRKFPSSPGHPSRAVESARPGPQAPGDGPYVDFVEYSPNARHLIVHYSKDQTARVFEPRSPPSDFPPSSSSWPPSPGTPPPRSPPGWKRHLPPYPGEAFARARAEARHRAQAEALLALAPENENGTQVSVL